MPAKKASLDGNVPDKNKTALLLIDVINDLEFPEAKKMLGAAQKMAHNLLCLKERAHQAGAPVIYVNDNFGRWQSDFRATIAHCLGENVRGRALAELLQPRDDDYFVLKPKHSGFFSTSLEILLRYLGSRRLVLTGIAGNFCVLFTASDAYMRDYELVVPRDCTISNTPRENRAALELMRELLKAETPLGKEILFPRKRTGRSVEIAPAPAGGRARFSPPR